MASSKASSLFFGIAALGLLAGCGAVFVNEGAKTNGLAMGLADPDANKPKPVVPKGGNVISDFEDGSKRINPNLFGGSGGSWTTITWDNNTVPSDIIVPGGANGTKMACHVFGTLIDHGNASYPAFTLQGKFKNSGFYDASAFTGIRFYYKCPADDNVNKRRFAIAIAPTLAAQDGGTCVNDCYNHFGAFQSPSDDWVLKSYLFNELKRESGWGSPVVPPDFTDHLKEVSYIKWDHSGDNKPGAYKVDYWVDEVEFF
ncbi:MAG TPA: hypothetical protein VMV05_00525 [bacterium]|nr:hypothetical protein [bacterium]